MRRVLHFYRDFSKKKVEERRETEVKLQEQLAKAQSDLHLDPCSFNLQLEVASVREKLADLERIHSEGQRLRSRIKWRDKGDGCNRDFFQMVRERPRAHSIAKLKDSDGTLKTEEKELQEICRRFYGDLYAAPDPPPDGTLEKALEQVTPRLSADMRQRLDREFSFEELREAAQALATDRAPGPDRVSIVFYTHHWDLLGHDFLNMINASIRSGRLPSCMLHGAITLIHKSGPKEDLGNWRPITLLNAAYKIIAKALQLRLKPLMEALISPDQTAFVPHRFILDNVFVAHETLDIAKRTKQPLLFLNFFLRKPLTKSAGHSYLPVWSALVWAPDLSPSRSSCSTVLQLR